MNTELKRFKSLLKKNGHFITQPRLRLFIILQEHNELTVHELIALLKRQDQATVYRNIKVFESLGIVSRLQLGWHSKLELSDVFQHHHHHISCVNCGMTTTLPENIKLEAMIKQVANQKNFEPLDHQLEIRGLCHNCPTNK